MLVVKARENYPKLYSITMMGRGTYFQQMAAFWACSRKVNGALEDEEMQQV